jgi:hypothetical protein
MNIVSKVVAMLLVILLLYIAPLLHNFQQQDELSSMIVKNAVVKFVDSTRDKGFITPTMYNEFTSELAQTGYSFDVDIVHEQKVYIPIYSDPSDPSTFTGEYEVHYDNYYSPQILPVLFPENSLEDDHKDRVYKLTTGDYFKVIVKNKNRSKATILQDFLTTGNTGNPVIINIPYGGMIHNEDY